MSLAFHSLNGYDNPNPASLGLQMFWCDLAKGFTPSDYFSNQDVPEIPIMYQGTFDPSDTGLLDSTGASAAHNWGISLSESLISGTGYNGYICLDWEAQMFTNLLWGSFPGGCATNPSVGACSQQAAISLLDVMKSLYPFAKIGYYAIPIGDYWRAFASDGTVSSSPPFQTTFGQWQDQNDYMKAIVDQQGVVFPSTYNNYVLTGDHQSPYSSFPHDGSAVWPVYPGGASGGYTSGLPFQGVTGQPDTNLIGQSGIQRDVFGTQRHWERYQSRVVEALRISDGKPVISFVWNRIHTNSDPYGGVLQDTIAPDGNYAKSMVHYAIREAKYTFTNAAGATITYRPTGYVVWDANNYWSGFGEVGFPVSYDPEVWASWTEPNSKMKYQIMHERGATAWNLEPVESTADHTIRTNLASFRVFRES